MHYYRFNIGDYQSHTAHLDDTEDLAYRRLLDWCYLHEKALPASVEEISRLIRMRTHCDRIANVLHEFFVQQPDGGWKSERVERELTEVHQKSEKAKQSAKLRWDANALRPQSERNATQDTRPNIQNTRVKNKAATIVAAPDGVSVETWEAFIAVRKARRSPVTPRALDGIRTEAALAGWSLEKALAECAARGWQGFKAEWVAQGVRQKPAQIAANAVLSGLTRGFLGVDRD